MKPIINISILLCTIFFITACEKDNYDPPNAFISGQIVYQEAPLQVRNGRIELELWQQGYPRLVKIPVYANQEGYFSANVFNGTYKLVLLRGVGPWAPNSDTININLSGTAEVTVPVVPYFTIENPQITKSGTSVTATCTINKVTASANIEYIGLYLSATQIVDVTNQQALVTKAAAALDPIPGSQTISINIPAHLVDKGYFYARIGVKTAGVEELIYSPVQKL